MHMHTMTLDLHLSVTLPALPRVNWGRWGRRAQAAFAVLADGIYETRHTLAVGAFACALAIGGALLDHAQAVGFRANHTWCHPTTCYQHVK